MLAFIFVLSLLVTLIIGGMCITFYLYTHHAIGNTRAATRKHFYNVDGSDLEEADTNSASMW